MAEQQGTSTKRGASDGTSQEDILNDSDTQLRKRRKCGLLNRTPFHSPVELEEARRSAVKQALVHHLSSLFKSIYGSFNVADYLHPEKMFKELDPNTFYLKTRAFLRSIPKMEGIGEDDLEQLLHQGLFPFFCFYLSVHLNLHNFPRSSDESINEFLTMIRYFCQSFHQMGFPTEDEEPLLCAQIFLQTNIVKSPNDRIIEAAREDIAALLQWCLQQQRGRFRTRAPINVTKFIDQLQPYLEVCRHRGSLPMTLQLLFRNGNW